MVHKIRPRAVWNIAVGTLIKWITNPRIIIAAVLLVFMKTLAIDPLLERVDKIGEPLNCLEPFIAVGNSGMLVMFMPCVFLILISDFPNMGGNTVFYIHRTGKLNWFLGQVLFLIMSIFLYLTALLLGCAAMSGGKISTEWSDAVSKYSAVTFEETGTFVSELIPSNLYNQMSVLNAALHTFILLALYMLLLALVLCLMKLLYLRIAGLFAVYTIIAFGVLTCSLKVEAMWLFPMANTLVWLHYRELLRKPITPVSDSFIYFAVLIGTLLAANLLVLRKLQFTNQEVEEASC